MKLTNDDFETFKKECEFWIDFFGLSDWKVIYEFKRINDAFACCYSDSIGRCATISLNNGEHEYITDIKKAAFHEVCELMLSDMHAYLSDFYSEGVCQQQTHYIIRKLENSVYKTLK